MADDLIHDQNAGIERLLEIMRRLRAPDTGCPWDIEQDFDSIAPYTIEEAYEVADAIARGDLDDLKEELGDLLLQIVFLSRLGQEQGRFDVTIRARSPDGKPVALWVNVSLQFFPLDQQGKQLASTELADLMNKHMNQGMPAWTIVIGGPYGLSAALRKKADLVLSLSAMALTHQMARLLILEQLYRCCTIIRNEPYHH